MDGIFQESQKPESPGKTQHESPREFNGHIKAFYSVTIQEPVSGLRDPISLTLRTLLVLAVSAFLLPLRAAQGDGKSPERGGAQRVWAQEAADLSGLFSHLTLTHAASREAGWHSSPEYGLWGPTELCSNPSPVTVGYES